MNDPLARRQTDDAPLFQQPREVLPPSRPAVRRPMAQTSLAAERSVDRQSDYLAILTWLNCRRVNGGTHGEWCDAFARESSTSGRFTELSSADLIVGLDGDTRRTASRRAGQVYRITTNGLAALNAGPAAILNAVRAVKRRKAS